MRNYENYRFRRMEHILSVKLGVLYNDSSSKIPKRILMYYLHECFLKELIKMLDIKCGYTFRILYLHQFAHSPLIHSQICLKQQKTYDVNISSRDLRFKTPEKRTPISDFQTQSERKRQMPR